MSKLKGSSSSIKMKYLLFVFATVMLVSLPTRVFQLIALVNTENGFYDEGNITIPVLYGVVFIFVLLFMLLSFLSKEVPSPKLPTARNPLLGASSFVMVAGLVWDIISIENLVVPKTGVDFSMEIFTTLLTDSIKSHGGILLVLQFVFAIFAIFYFLVFAISHINGKGSYKEFKLLALSPLCWSITSLVSKLMEPVSFITSSELLFEIFMFVFSMLFFLTFARISSGVFTEDSMWGIYGYGLSACLFAGLVTFPRIVAIIARLDPVDGHPFSFAHLAILVFIFTYVLASLGVGFKDGISNRRTVTQIELPDDDEIVEKGSVGSSFVAEVDADEEEEFDSFFEEKSDEETDFSYDEAVEENIHIDVAAKKEDKVQKFFDGFSDVTDETAEVSAEDVEEAEEVLAEDPAEAVIDEPVELIEEQEAASEEIVEDVEEAPEEAEEETEKVKKTFGKRKKDLEPEVIKPVSLADIRKNNEE